MISVENFKPERDFSIDESITIEEIRRKCAENETVTGSIYEVNVNECFVRVYLGNSIEGIMPFNEICLGNLKLTDGVPAQVKSVARKPVIRAKITSVKGNQIFLSRRENLLEVSNKIKKLGKAFFNASIENVNPYNIFCDIGEGVIAYCSVEELTRIFIDDARDWVTAGNHIRVRIIKTNDSENLIWCSVKKASMGNYKKIKPRTKIMAKVGKSIKDESNNVTGFFVEITPAISGIADIPENYSLDKLPKLGDMVKCYVRAVNSEKHRIKLYIDD